MKKCRRCQELKSLDKYYKHKQCCQLQTIQSEIFTNPVTQISSYSPLDVEFDWTIWVGYRPGVRDNPGSTAMEAVADILGTALGSHGAIYTSKRYCLKGKSVTRADADKIAGELLANDIIQQWKIYAPAAWDPDEGIGIIIPKVVLDHTPTVTTIPVDNDAALAAVSNERGLALNPADIPTIRAYFLDKDVQAQREAAGLSDPTDIELEYISQARSDHCNHNTFQGLFRYRDLATGASDMVDNLRHRLGLDGGGHLARFDLCEIEDLIDQREEVIAAAVDDLCCFDLAT